MAFVAEDGSGLAGANSLASVEHADQYHSLRGNTAWGNFELAEKQQRLVVATDYLVDVFGGSLAGLVGSDTQGLPFPRLGSTAVPGKVLDATSELALISKTTPLLTVIKRGKKRVKVGPIDVQYDGDEQTQAKFPGAVMKMLPFLVGYGNSSINVKLVRC